VELSNKLLSVRYWTVQIGRKWFFINTYHLIGIGIAIFGLILASGITAFQVVSSNIKAKRTVIEKKKTLKLNLALENLSHKINLLDSELNSLINLDKTQRLVWGLPHIDEDIRALGVGGGGPANIDPVGEALSKLQMKLDFEIESFKEISHGIENKKDLLSHTPSIWPVTGVIASGFGWRISPFSGRREFHEGLDITNDVGTPIVAPADGVVSYVGYDGYKNRLGLTVEIDHGFGYTTRYGHLSRAAVEPHKRVKRGEIIGWTGNSGRTTGPHLHYEVRVTGKAVAPLTYIIPDSITF